MNIPLPIQDEITPAEPAGSIPKSDLRVLIVYPNLPLMLVPSLAIALFTSILKKRGYQVQLFDTTAYISEEGSSPQNRVKYLQARQFSDESDLGTTIKEHLLSDFRQAVIEFQPHAMIFSVVEDAFMKTTRMLDAVKDLDVPHILGGVFPTAAPERCISFDRVKMIGLGEGEKTIVDFVEAVRCRRDLRQIPGTWYKDESGTVHKNPKNKLVNINDVVPDFSLFDDVRFYRPMGGRIFKTVPIETYRGCPYKCTFCNSPMQVQLAKQDEQGFFLRRKTMDNLRSEIKHLIDLYDPEFFYFIDDSFLARPAKEIEQFCEMYEEFALPFWFNTRPENCTEKNMEMLREAGCYRISFGIECGNEDYRRNILKRYVSNDTLVEHFNIIANSGIAFSANLIIGFPGETRELIMDTVEFVKKVHGYDTLTVSMFTPYHGTELRAVAEKNGWMDATAITVHTTSRSMLSMPSPYVSADDLDGLMRVLPLYCYFPHEEWSQIRRAEIDDEEGNRLLEHYSAIYKEKFLKETQDDQKDFVVTGGTGCRSNPKDSVRVKLTQAEIEMLTV